MKHTKILLLITAVLLLVVLASGCDSKDINDKQIATVVAFDFKDGEIWGYIEMANHEAGMKSDASTGTSGEKYIYIKGHGKTLNEVKDDLDNQLHKPQYLSGILAIVLSESFAKEYLLDFFNYFKADELYRKKVQVAITMDDPEALLITLHKNNNSVGFTIDDLLMTLDATGKSFSRTSTRLLENLSSKYSGILISCVGLNDEDIAQTGYSVLNGTIVDGFIPVPAKGLVFLKADKPKHSYTVPYNDNNLNINVSLTKRKIKTYYEAGIITFNVSTQFKAELISGDKKMPYNFGETDYAQIGAMLEGVLKQELEDAVSQAQNEFECDYLQFDDEFRINYPAAFEQLDWQSEFLDANINIEAKVEMSSSWMMDYGAYQLK